MMPEDIKTASAEPPEEQSPDDALESFLSRENTEKSPKKARGNKKSVIILIAAALTVAALTAAIFVINSLPTAESGEDSYVEAKLTADVDDQGLHTARVPLNSDGEPQQNGSGSLLSYVPSQIELIEVKNADGSFTVSAHTHEGEATEYTLVGYEDFALQTGMPDNVANDAAQLSFSTVASTGGNIADFGLDSPRAEVKVSFTDSTKAVIRVGGEAPASAGTYIAFGDSDEVYLVSDDAVDSFLYKLTELISLTVTESAESVDDSALTRLTLSGSRYPESIVIEPNDDEDDTEHSYKLTAPEHTLASEYAAADIAGSIRGLYASEVAAVISSDSELADYGLDKAFAEVKAEYPDITIRLRASEPDDSGDVYLIDLTGNTRVIYKIQLGAVSWANTSLEALTD